MFVNKVGNSHRNQVFKGYQHEVDNVGRQVARFNFPYNYDQDHYCVEFYNVKRNPDKATGYEVIADKPIKKFDLTPNGVVVNFRDIKGLRTEDAFAYKIIQPGYQTLVDTGVQQDGCVIVTTRGTTPMVQGAGVLSMPDLHRPGAYYDEKTGEVIYNPNKQKEAEQITRTFANRLGGSLAGYEYELDDLNNPDGVHLLKDVKVLFSTPVVGGDNRSGFLYWNKNNMDIASTMGTEENYESFVRKLYQHGIKFVNDGTFTSGGLEDIHFQYALRHADQKSQTSFWFRLLGLDNGPLGLGVIPMHSQNLRHKVINAPSIYDVDSGKVMDNPDYDSTKETYIQIYDATQVTDEQAKDLTRPIKAYGKPKTKTPLDINTHDDTVINYVFEIFDPSEYTKRLEELRDYNATAETPIVPNSPEGTKFIGQFSSYKLIGKKDGGFQTWDANTDMVKVNSRISGYDEKGLKSVVDRSQRDYITKMIVRGTYETQDLDMQVARRWTRKSRLVQTLYTAQVLQNATTKEAIDKLISEGKLPQEASLSQDAIDNILDGFYMLEPKGVLDKDDVTIKSLMSLPLDSLKLGENTVGVLSTSYFSNRATTPETIGLTRFELMQQDEPHLVEEYAENYMKMNRLYKNELKNFADRVIQKVNETSAEKLLDDKGNYTLYGEYVVEMLGQSIAKYALLKAIGGKHTEAWMFADGTITYDYDKLQEHTTLRQLGVRSHNPADEAAELRKVIERGLHALNNDDVDFVAKSVSQRIEGTNTDSFSLAEAIVAKAGLGLDWRLDAIKDKMDMDAVRNGDLTFDEAWDQLIAYCQKLVQSIKKENPHVYVVAEITDIEELMQSMFGNKVSLYDYRVDIGNKYKSVPEAMTQFYLQTGITSEAGYSYTFTDLLRVFSQDFVEGKASNMQGFMNSFFNILNNRSVDFIRNLWTFADNHDKPSVIHGMALDIPLLNGNIETTPWIKEAVMRILTNTDYGSSLPLEAQYFLYDNNYYRLASTKAAAMGKLMRDCINGSSTISDEQKTLLKQAVANLVNGNFLGEGPQFKLAFHEVPALSSLEGALTDILTKAGILLPEDEFKRIVSIAQDKIDGYFADKNPKSQDNITRLKLMLSGEKANPNEYKGDDLDRYSLYTTAVACALREAFYAVRPNVDETSTKFNVAQKEYVTQYNDAYIKAKQAELPFEEDSYISMQKNGFGAKDFETVIKMIIEEAEYLAQKSGNLKAGEHFINSDEILKELFINSTKPAVTKAVMYASFLSALPGIPTIFVRDMLGALGFDEKAKNIYLQNRNAIPWSQLEEGPLKEYRTEILKSFMEALEIRTNGGDALSHGTPYRATTSNDAIPAIFMQDGHGNMTVSVFDALGVNHQNTKEPEQRDDRIEYILLGTGLSLPIGLEFVNAINPTDKATYVVDEIKKDNKSIGRGIKVKGGDYIALSKDTLKNGVMVLKRLSFKGNSRQINKQYNIVTNPYKKVELAQEGQNLSIIAK